MGYLEDDAITAVADLLPQLILLHQNNSNHNDCPVFTRDSLGIHLGFTQDWDF